MPLLDSFTVDHTIMGAPARVAKTMNTPHGDTITVFDLRFCRPNIDILTERGIHTLEHLFAGFMRNHLNGDGVEIVDIHRWLPHRLLYEPDWYARRAARGKSVERRDGRCAEGKRSEPDSGTERIPVRQLQAALAGRSAADARNVLAHDIGVNRNEDLKLPAES